MRELWKIGLKRLKRDAFTIAVPSIIFGCQSEYRQQLAT